jgi:hypothetical protein
MGKTLQDTKQATLTFDSTPTDTSTNPVTSNGVFDALATKIGATLAVALNTARATVISHATTAQIWTALGNQIDWTGTATTTAFPTAPQAGAERTLICAGACGFTAGANMLIDGVLSGATVTCAAGDTVIVRAISTTQFKLTRLKADGTAQVSAASGVGDHRIFVSGGNGHGTTKTKIRAFTSTVFSVGTAITYATTAANGGSFTINTAGLYAINYMDRSNASATQFGVSKNYVGSVDNIGNIAAANIVGLNSIVSATNSANSFCHVLLLEANDVIRAHTDGSPNATGAEAIAFSIYRLGGV